MPGPLIDPHTCRAAKEAAGWSTSTQEQRHITAVRCGAGHGRRSWTFKDRGGCCRADPAHVPDLPCTAEFATCRSAPSAIAWRAISARAHPTPDWTHGALSYGCRVSSRIAQRPAFSAGLTSTGWVTLAIQAVEVPRTPALRTHDAALVRHGRESAAPSLQSRDSYLRRPMAASQDAATRPI